MKYSYLIPLILFIIALFCSCIDDDIEKFKKSCPYDLQYSGHYLRVPITITPHKKIYNIGDTINISTIFSDSIYDLGTQQTFKIEGFPFKPLSLLFRFTSKENYDSGYSINELLIENKYNHLKSYSEMFTDGFLAYSIYENNMYKFEIKLILKETGRYIMLFSDSYQNNSGSGNGDLNAEADAITFEGKCPTLGYYICSMIEGDDHLDSFEDELIYLDEEVYRGKLRSREGEVQTPLGTGGLFLEWNGFFGFEVTE